MDLFFKEISSPVGKLKLVASDRGLSAILWEQDSDSRVPLGALTKNVHHPILVETERQLLEYFSGRRTTFNLDFDLMGTDFQKKVWTALSHIPFGQTCSYKELAIKIGNPRASRAVGAANGKNPVSIIIPCHRVIGSTGKLTGFAGGLKNKTNLLQFEKENLSFSK